ncbi:MAG: hypothetical protein ABW249_04200 [Solirubrobacterales bacterium]
MRRWLISSAAVGALIGIPALILQRWVAETRFAAIVLVLAWFALVGSGSRPTSGGAGPCGDRCSGPARARAARPRFDPAS